MSKKQTETLDAAFRRRFNALSANQMKEDDMNESNTGILGFTSRNKRLTLRKGTVKAIEKRRDSLFDTIDRRVRTNL